MNFAANPLALDLSLLDAVRQLDALDRVDCEESLYEFFIRAWRYMDPAPFKGAWCMEAVAEHLQAVADGEIRRLNINIPPRCSKSLMTSVAFPAWVWIQRQRSATSGPGVKFLSASYANQLSLRDNVKCRRLIESPWYQNHWGNRFELTSDQNTKNRFLNSEGGERLITSIGGTGTGEGGDIILIDDANSASEAFSELKTQEVLDWWDGTMSTRLNDMRTGAFINIQQRLAENDLSGHILEKDDGEWTHLMLPMEYEPDRSITTSIGWKDPRTKQGELLWPDRFGPEEVASLKKSMGSFTAAGQLQQRPEPPGGGIIKRDWWKCWESDQYPAMDYVIASLDTAYTIKTANDYSAMTVWGVFIPDDVADRKSMANRTIDADGRPVYIERTYDENAPNLLLMHAWQERLEFHDLIQKVNKLCRIYRVDKLLVENKAAGISLAQEMRRLFGSENFAIQLADPKNMDKMARLFSIQHIFEEGMVYAPDKAWAEMTIAQVGQFPKGKHDDIVDTVSQGVRHLRDVGLLTRRAERDQEVKDAFTYPGGQLAPLYPA